MQELPLAETPQECKCKQIAREVMMQKKVVIVRRGGISKVLAETVVSGA